MLKICCHCHTNFTHVPSFHFTCLLSRFSITFSITLQSLFGLSVFYFHSYYSITSQRRYRHSAPYSVTSPAWLSVEIILVILMIINQILLNNLSEYLTQSFIFSQLRHQRSTILSSLPIKIQLAPSQDFYIHTQVTHYAFRSYTVDPHATQTSYMHTLIPYLDNKPFASESQPLIFQKLFTTVNHLSCIQITHSWCLWQSSSAFHSSSFRLSPHLIIRLHLPRFPASSSATPTSCITCSDPIYSFTHQSHIMQSKPYELGPRPLLATSQPLTAQSKFSQP